MTEPSVSAPAFHHTDQGTPETSWWNDQMWDQVPVIDLDALSVVVDEVLVVSAHPDDESIGCGATIAALAARGLPITFVLATDGEGSHPDSRVWSPADIAQIRGREFREALGQLAPQARIHCLGLPDGEVSAHQPRIVDALSEFVGDRTLVLAPFSADGHPDHEACGRAAQALGRGHLLQYPVWWWHWNTPSEVAGLIEKQAVLSQPGAGAVHAKHRALAAYESQTAGLGPGPDHGPVVSEMITRRARRQLEVFFTEQRDLPLVKSDPVQQPQTFDQMYDDGDDPWRHEQSGYEARRRDLLAAFPARRRYRRALEIGCATGLVTERLIRIADHVDAMDISERALQVARRRDLPRVTWWQGIAPTDLPVPPADYDLVVLSEVGYFLSPVALAGTLRRIDGLLSPDGELVAVHWRHRTEHIPSDGPLVHEQIHATFPRPHRASYRDADLLIESWGPAGSVAGDEGLL